MSKVMIGAISSAQKTCLKDKFHLLKKEGKYFGKQRVAIALTHCKVKRKK